MGCSTDRISADAMRRPAACPLWAFDGGFRFADTICVIRAPTIDILASVAQIGAPLPATEEACRTKTLRTSLLRETIR